MQVGQEISQYAFCNLNNQVSHWCNSVWVQRLNCHWGPWYNSRAQEDSGMRGNWGESQSLKSKSPRTNLQIFEGLEEWELTLPSSFCSIQYPSMDCMLRCLPAVMRFFKGFQKYPYKTLPEMFFYYYLDIP